MLRKLNWKETAGVVTILAILVGVPAVLWQWRHHVLHHHAADTKVVMLTAIADRGIWTQDEVVGWNYWWKKPTRAENIPLQQGDRVLLRLRSADVLHSFAIPLLRFGPVEVPSGHTVQVEFRADRPGTLTFLCWTMCSPEHQNLHGRFLVQGNGNENDSW